MTALDVVLLCGGRGTRAYPDTLELPKPLLPVGDRPVVEHVMGCYARQGHTRFILAAGYKAELLQERYAIAPEGWDVAVVDTGVDTETGDRVRLAAEAAGVGSTFFVNYADGLGDVDLTDLVAFHHSHGALATVTTVPLPSQYGTLVSDDKGLVTEFREKPVLEDHWINAGYFVFERRALDDWSGPELERDTLPALSQRRQLVAYRHRGFWRSMDTYKDRSALTALVESAERAPWER
ncbi:MAG TPA: sugar phosphate nucleotidyltransferase [Acidimicrobiales bacterium]|nr:sugar phosphate nucleotidyltransferase [Acidimicrobiales bacterium]